MDAASGRAAGRAAAPRPVHAAGRVVLTALDRVQLSDAGAPGSSAGRGSDHRPAGAPSSCSTLTGPTRASAAATSPSRIHGPSRTWDQRRPPAAQGRHRRSPDGHSGQLQAQGSSAPPAEMFEGNSSSSSHGPGATPCRRARVTRCPLAARRRARAVRLLPARTLPGHIGLGRPEMAGVLRPSNVAHRAGTAAARLPLVWPSDPRTLAHPDLLPALAGS